ncbi:hypothetical protein BGZ73_001470, partial [Actinomortierella ambigua]
MIHPQASNGAGAATSLQPTTGPLIIHPPRLEVDGDPIDWLMQYQLCATCNDWQPDKMLRMVPACIDAAIYSQQNFPYTTFEGFVTDFKATFQTPDYILKNTILVRKYRQKK